MDYPHYLSFGGGVNSTALVVRLVQEGWRGEIVMAGIRWCTAEWKVNPLKRYTHDAPIMLGIAADESHRKSDAIHPLVDMGIDRAGCIEIIKRAGLDVPQKSGCFICPFQRASQWRELWHRHPDLYAQAEALEANVKRSKKSGYAATLDVAGKVTLQQRRLTFESQIELPEIDLDELRQYQPCICSL